MAAVEEVKAETVPDVEVKDGSEDDSDDDLPELENAEGAKAGDDSKNPSRLEKKARKALLKMGLTPQAGFSRVTMKKAPGILFVIAQPEVYRAPGTDMWVVFGDYKIEDMQAQAQAQYAQQLRLIQEAANKAESEAKAVEGTEGETKEVAAEEESADETGLEAKDIELVTSQANVSRAKAVKALRNNNGDVVNAIMELTM